MQILKPLNIWLVVLALVACGTPDIKPIDPEAVNNSELLAFIKARHTTREEIVSRFGPPYSKYENGRIVTYMLYEPLGGDFKFWNKDQYGFKRSPDSSSRICTLVIVYDEQNIAVENSLVCSRLFE